MSVKDGLREAIRAWLVVNTDYSDEPFVKLEPVEFKKDVECSDHESPLLGGRAAMGKDIVPAVNLVFMDASAFKAYYDKKDKHHGFARSFVDSVVRRENEFRL
mgnify:CR=1 FL=1